MTDVPKRGRGRPAGTTRLDDQTRQVRKNVMLDATHQEIALRAGEGNLSAGVRIALDHWEEFNKRRPGKT